MMQWRLLHHSQSCLYSQQLSSQHIHHSQQILKQPLQYVGENRVLNSKIFIETNTISLSTGKIKTFYIIPSSYLNTLLL